MTEIFGSTNSIIKRMERTIYRKWSEGRRERGGWQGGVEKAGRDGCKEFAENCK